MTRCPRRSARSRSSSPMASSSTRRAGSSSTAICSSARSTRGSTCLLAIETGEVSLPFSNLPINSVLIASSNEIHLAAFKEHHEYNSFRGRIQLVRVPYLLDYRQEQEIYDVADRAAGAPSRRAARDLRAPRSGPCSRACAARSPTTTTARALGRIAGDLTPLEKAELYATAPIPTPSRDGRRAGAARRASRDIVTEWDARAEYEGLTGASPREIRTLLLDAAQRPQRELRSRRSRCSSARGVLRAQRLRLPQQSAGARLSRPPRVRAARPRRVARPRRRRAAHAARASSRRRSTSELFDRRT